MNKIPIVFFGSGPVALHSLELLTDTFAVEAIITKPATKKDMEAVAQDAKVFVVQSRIEVDAVCSQERFASQLAILIDFGIIVSQNAIDAFPLGIINSHFSLLPEWRGADPITFAILSGQKRTGVSLMVLTAGMDEGPLLAQAPYEVPDHLTAPELTDDLVKLSAKLLKAIIPGYISGNAVAAPQMDISIAPEHIASYSRKLTKQDGHLDWAKPAATLEREIRAYITWPHSYASLAGRDIIVTRAQVAQLRGKPGAVIAQNQHLYICCSEDALEILSLKPAGKKEMPASAFLAGYGKLL